MKKKKTRKSNIGLGTLIGIAITALLAVFLFHPNWLPVSEETRNTIKELEKNHFLIQRSGTITIAHVLTVILALLVVWLCYTLVKLLMNAIGKKSPRALTITAMITGTLKYLARRNHRPDHRLWRPEPDRRRDHRSVHHL